MGVAHKAAKSTSDTLGYIYAQTGRHHEALTWYQRALDHYDETGDRLNGAIVRGHLAECHQARGRSFVLSSSGPTPGRARFGCWVCLEGATHRTVLERMCILDEVRERQTT